jgi:hypothetical protein
MMTLALNTTVLAPCEWCEQYDLDEPLVSVENGQLNLCLACYYDDYCEACRLCDDLLDPDEIDNRIFAVVTETPGFPNPVPPGIYEARGAPYYTQPVIGTGRLWSDQLRLVAPLTPFDDDQPPCGYLCPRCRLDALHGGLDLPGEVE